MVEHLVFTSRSLTHALSTILEWYIQEEKLIDSNPIATCALGKLAIKIRAVHFNLGSFFNAVTY